MSSSAISATTRIYELLSRDEELKNLVKDNIFPIAAPLETSGDFIVLARQEYKENRNNMLAHEEIATILLNVISTEYIKGLEILERVRSVLRDANFCPDIVFVDGEETITGWGDSGITKYVQTLTFEVSSLALNG